jgi:hypothetical protein
MKHAMLIASAIFVSIFFACEPPLIIRSKWIDSDVQFSGDTAAWKTMVQYPEDPQFGIGARNNGTFLYLCMASWKREANSNLLRYGFTTWFTSKSKKGKRFGLHFPMGLPDNSAMAGRHHHGGSQGLDPTMVEQEFQKMELLGPAKTDSTPVKTAVAETFGITVRMFPSVENLVYFIKVPLNADSTNTYAIDIGKDSLVEVSFASDVPELTTAHESSGEGQSSPSPMGGGGAGGARGNGAAMHSGGGHEGASHEETVESFSAGFTIGLAKK